MKILLVTSGYYPLSLGGVEKYTYDLAHQLSAQHAVTVFTRMSDRQERRYATRQWRDGKVTVFGIVNSARCSEFLDTYLNPTVENVYAAFLNECRPDLVHFQHVHTLSVRLIEITRQRNIPHLLSLHDYWYICPAMESLKPSGEPCVRNLQQRDCIACFKYYNVPQVNRILNTAPAFLKKILPMPVKKKAQAWLLQLGKKVYPQHNTEETTFGAQHVRDTMMQQTLNQIGILLAPSQFIKKKYQEFGVTKPEIMVQPLGIDTAALQTVIKNPSPTVRFAYLGTFHPLKGIHTAIQAFRNITKRNCHFAVYGDPLANITYSRTITRDLPAHITCKGKYTADQLPTILANIDVVIVPSIWDEVYSFVIREAFAAKIPVLASRVGGIPESIFDGNNGMLFEAGNVNELTQKINQILDDPSVITAWQKNIRPVVTIQQQARTVVDIYRQVIQRNITRL